MVSPALVYRKIDGHKYRTRGTLVFDVDIFPAAEVESPDGWVWLSVNGKLHIRAGYLWDGASGGMWDSENVMVPSLVHDALYQLMRERVLPQSYRLAADTVFWKMCRQRGMSAMRAGYAYRLLRTFGEKAARPRPPDKGVWLTAL